MAKRTAKTEYTYNDICKTNSYRAQMEKITNKILRDEESVSVKDIRLIKEMALKLDIIKDALMYECYEKLKSDMFDTPESEKFAKITNVDIEKEYAHILHMAQRPEISNMVSYSLIADRREHD